MSIESALDTLVQATTAQAQAVADLQTRFLQISAVALAGAGLPGYATKALLLAVTPGAGDPHVAYVYDDPTPTNNVVYQYVDAAWTEAIWFGQGLATVVQPLVDAAQAAQAAAEAARDEAQEAATNVAGLQGYSGSGVIWGLLSKTRKRATFFQSRRSGDRFVHEVPVEMYADNVMTGKMKPGPSKDVDLFDRYYLDGRSRKARIVGWGDSLLQNPNATNTVFARMQQLYPSRLWQNSGKAGLTSGQALTQMGARQAYFTVAGNVIPASGSVVLTAIDGNLGNTQQSTQYEGELFGVKGVLTFSTSAGYSFLRTSIGAPVAVPAAAGIGIPFTLSGVGHLRDSKVLISVGRNNLNPAIIIPDLQQFVAWLGHDDFGIYSILNTRAEPIGNANYNTVLDTNARILSTFGPDHYVSMREDLLAASDPADQANGIISVSLLGDGTLHVNDAGAAVNAVTLNTFVTARGWV